MELDKIRKNLNLGIPITKMKLRVTDYARVSTEDKRQKKSLENQVEHFDAFIKNNPNWCYIKGYVDDGITGTSDIKREQFMKMIEDAKEGKFDLIVTKEISRFSRNTLDSIKYTRELLQYGVAVLFVNDNINTALPDAELRLTIMASMAQDEIRRLSERVRFGMTRAIEKGEILGNDNLYGYKKNKKTGCLEIIEEEAEVVRRLFHLYAIDLYPINQIAVTFNNEHILPRSGKKWLVTTLSRMLENPKYKGYYCGNKTKISDYMTKKVTYLEKEQWKVYKDDKKIPPLIEEELWDKANDRLLQRQLSYRRRTSDKEIYKNRYIFSAKIICGKDREIYYRRKFTKNKEEYCWICSKYLKEGKKACGSPFLRETELMIILNELLGFFFDYKAMKEKLLAFYNRENINTGFCELIKKKEKESEIIHSKKEKLLELTIEQKVSNEEFAKRNDHYNKTLQDIATLLENLKKEDQCNSRDKINNKIAITIETLLKEKEVTMLIFQMLLEKIVVLKKMGQKDSFLLDIFFTGHKKGMQENCLHRHYSFKRGYHTVGTKGYTVNYEVKCYF